MQEIKILSSNFTLQEQNHSIKSNLLNLNKAGISIFNSSYSGFFDGNTGIFESLKETEQTDIKEKINIVFSSNIVKFIIKSLIKNPINRIFTIVCNDKKCVIKDHLLSSELLFDSISSYNGEIHLDLSFINAFRLNNKTCNSNSYIYLTNSYIIYENIRGNKKSIYLKKRRIL